MRRDLQRTVVRSFGPVAMWSLLFLGIYGGCASSSEGPAGASGGDTACESGRVWRGECQDAERDSDADGLPDHTEEALGTDPLSPDSDADGLIDSYEVGSPGAPTDSDGDGTIDALESRLTDADCDGLSDEQDPTDDPGPDGATRVDTDGDGAPDTCWVDTDGDGLADHADCEPADPDISDTCPPGPPCATTVCQPGAGCVDEPVSCDDDDLCTSDKCDQSTGACHHIEVVCDTDPCTDDVCDPQTGACLIVEKDCIDDLLCTDGEYCDSTTGECLKNYMDCDSGDPCIVAFCVPETGLCDGTPVACDDQNACTVDSCDAATGECIITGLTCDDSSLCTTDLCDPATGDCSYEPVCGDGDACTIDECDSETGACEFLPKSCDDDLLCTQTVCDSVTGACDHVPIDCDDFDACTLDNCEESFGACVHQDVTCSDSLPCTEDSCDPSLGCVYTPKDCEGGDPCMVGSCQPEDGACAFAPVDCDDEDACTVDVCDTDFDGACVHESVDCDDDDPCTDDECVSASGDCVHTPMASAVLTLGSLETVTTGLALWNAGEDAPEGAGSGHMVSACGGSPSAYYLASSDHGGIAPLSAGVAVGLSAAGLDDFMTHLETMGLDVNGLTLRLGLGSLGEDQEGADWFYDAEEEIETRHYQDVTLEVWLEDKPLVTSTLPQLTATVDHGSCSPLPRPMTLQSGSAYAIDLTATSSPSTQLAAQLLLESLGVPATIQLALEVSTDDVIAFEADGRTGHQVGPVTGALTGVSCDAP